MRLGSGRRLGIRVHLIEDETPALVIVAHMAKSSAERITTPARGRLVSSPLRRFTAPDLFPDQPISVSSVIGSERTGTGSFWYRDLACCSNPLPVIGGYQGIFDIHPVTEPSSWIPMFAGIFLVSVSRTIREKRQPL